MSFTEFNQTKCAMKIKIPLILFILMAIAFSCLYKTIFDSKIDINGDDSSYFLLAKSLSQGKGYVVASDKYMQAHNHFPVGYPFLMALFMKLSPSLGFMKVLNGIFLFGSVFLVYLIQLRITKSHLLFIPILLLCFTNFYLLKYSTITMSEVPYMFFSVAGIFLFLQVKDFEGDLLKNYRFYLLILVSVITLYIRTVGLSLILALTIAFILKRRFKIAQIYFISTILMYAPWVLRAKIMNLGNPYLEAFYYKNPYDLSLGKIGIYDLWLRFLENLERYISMEIPEALFPYLTIGYDDKGNALSEYAIGIVCAVIFLFYIIKNVKNDNLVIILYVVLTYCILLIWPSQWFGVRFMLPLIPLLYFAIVTSLRQFLGFIFTNNYEKIPNYVAVVLSFLFFSVAAKKPKRSEIESRQCISSLIDESKKNHSPAYSNFFKVAEYCRIHLPDTAIVSSRKPAMFAIYSGGYTCNFPNVADEKVFREHFKNAKYVVVDQLGYNSTSKYLVPFINGHPQDFEQVAIFKEPDTYLFRYNK